MGIVIVMARLRIVGRVAAIADWYKNLSETGSSWLLVQVGIDVSKGGLEG